MLCLNVKIIREKGTLKFQRELSQNLANFLLKIFSSLVSKAKMEYLVVHSYDTELSSL
jgi:hypothetical protein